MGSDGEVHLGTMSTGLVLNINGSDKEFDTIARKNGGVYTMSWNRKVPGMGLYEAHVWLTVPELSALM